MLLNEQWPTRDRIIPWRLFVVLYRQIDRLEARERLRMTHAVLYAIGASFGEDRAAAERLLEDLTRTAE